MAISENSILKDRKNPMDDASVEIDVIEYRIHQSRSFLIMTKNIIYMTRGFDRSVNLIKGIIKVLALCIECCRSLFCYIKTLLFNITLLSKVVCESVNLDLYILLIRF